MLEGEWARRAARARELAEVQTAAAELLRFYAGLAERQAAIGAAGRPEDADGCATAPVDRRFRDVDLEEGIRAIPGLLAWLRSAPVVPRPLAEAAVEMTTIAPVAWRHLAEAHVTTPFEVSPPSDAAAVPAPDLMLFVLESALQPVAERAVAARPRHGADRARAADDRRCPSCSALPVVGILREEGHGTRRTLQCGLCLSEWAFPRVACCACNETQFDRLPVFTSEKLPHVRIDACDGCKVYLKTIDLSKDGRAVPLVDDLATVALDLWAREQGYQRRRPNLLRL